MLEVAVGDRAGEVVRRDNEPLHLKREWSSPQVGVPFRVEVHSSHSRLGGVSGAQESRGLRDNLSEVGWSLAQARGEAAEGVKALPHEGVDTDPVSFGLVLRPLQGAE